jgi:hypothetical protein
VTWPQRSMRRKERRVLAVHFEVTNRVASRAAVFRLYTLLRCHLINMESDSKLYTYSGMNAYMSRARTTVRVRIPLPLFTWLQG